MRKKLYLVIILAAATGLAWAAPAFSAEMVDRIVATVNGEIITLRDLDARFKPIANSKDIKTKKESDELRKQVLDAMIDQILTLNEGRRKGVEVDDQELDNTIEKIKQDNSLTQEQLEAQIKARGGNMQTFKYDLRVDMTRATLINREVRNRVVVTDEMVEEYIKRYGAPAAPETPAQPTQSAPPASQTASGMVHIRNISLSVPPNPTESQVRSVMEDAAKIRAEIQGGMDFASAAAMHSDSSNKAEGGDLGTLAWQDLNPQLRQELQNLKAGDVSRPVFLGGTVQLFQIVDLEGPKPVAAPGVAPAGGPVMQKDRVRQMLVESKLKEKYEEWLHELRSKAAIKVSL